MRLFTEITQWSAYVASQLAIAEVDERFAEAAVEKAKVILGIDLRTKAGRHEASDGESEYWSLMDTYQERMAYRKLVNVMFSNLEKKASLLSRELSRRTAFAPQAGRAERHDA